MHSCQRSTPVRAIQSCNYRGLRRSPCRRKKTKPPLPSRAAEASFHPLQPYFAAAVAGLKTSANAFPFGVPPPVTLSQPTFVYSAVDLLHVVPSSSAAGSVEQSVPNESTSLLSSTDG